MSEALFSKKNRKLMTDPLVDDNPVAVQVLGICSALAVTAQLKPSLIMSISVIAVIACSNVIISILRNAIPGKIRLIVELAIIASLVILVEQVLKAFAYDMYKQLSVFVGLIITNCIVMGRAEAFALGNKPWPSLLDGIGSGLGYGVIILIVGAGRELFGAGTLFGVNILNGLQDSVGYVNNGLMVLPPGAFMIIGLLIWWQRQYTGKFEEH